MKKHLLICSIFLSVNLLCAQNFIDKHYAQLEEIESSTVVHVAKMTFQIAATAIPENENDEQRVKEMVSSIESFDLVQVPDLADAKDTYRGALSKLESQFEELLNVKEDGGKFSVHINENGGIIYELVGLGQEENEFTLFSLVGEIALEDLGYILSKLDLGSIDPMAKAGSIDVSELSIYPNPVNSASEITIQIPSEMIGANASLVDMNGSVVHSFIMKSTTQEVGVKALEPGYYVVSLNKEGITMKKKVLVIR